jgi:hypothetical protein
VDFNNLKEFVVVYVIGNRNKIEKYDLAASPKCLFGISSGKQFSNGFGGSWNYSDYGVTWSDRKEVLYEVLFEELRDKAEKFDNINNVLNTDYNATSKLAIIQAYLNGFYGTMYGMSSDKDKVIHVEQGSLFIGISGDLLYVWGWPGPDYNRYKPDDYGNTWALFEHEIMK